MADEEMELGGEGEEEEKKSGGGLKKIIIIVLLVVILGAGGFFGWQFFMAEPETPEGEDAQQTEQAAAEEGKEGEAAGQAAGKPGTVVNLEPFVVNLAEPSGRRYLKLTLSVDAQNEKLATDLQDRMPAIRDSILLLLTSKSYADISTMAGKQRLKNEILKAVNRSLAGVGSVHVVYFTEFVIQ